MKSIRKQHSKLLVALLLGGLATNVGAESASSSAEQVIANAIHNSARPAADSARDDQRKPAAVLEFFDIRPGQDVLDMYSGGGYYTELLSRIVGEDGTVTAHNNGAYAAMSSVQRNERYADNRLANVKQVIADGADLKLPPNAYDRVMFILSYHDVYYLDGQRGWVKVDREALLEEVFDATRQGGIVGVIDHVAAKDAPAEALANLHRIHPDLVRQDFEAAGFESISSSDLLANPDDDLGVMPMLPTNRGKSDRFIFAFRKP